MIQYALLSLLLSLPVAGAAADLEWVTPREPKFEVNGLPWFAENNGEFIRFPLRLKGTLPKEVWNLSMSPSGARIRFRTDSNKLSIRLEYPSPPNMANMHAFGQTGVDLYLDGVYRGTAIAPKDVKPGEPVEHAYFDLGDKPAIDREVTLYLPLYKPVKVVGLGLVKAARVSPARPFRIRKPVVFYGTSITQGGCASRPGMSYQAILGRMLNVDFVNLGFSGNGKGEPEVARAVAEIDAACYVLDYAQNNRTVESLQTAYDAFLHTLREKHPDAPVIAITPIANAQEELARASQLEKMRAHIRDVVSRQIAAGDHNLQLIEGTDLIGPGRLDAFVDGTHPNDLGFQWMAEGIAARLGKVLGIRSGS